MGPRFRGDDVERSRHRVVDARDLPGDGGFLRGIEQACESAWTESSWRRL